MVRGRARLESPAAGGLAGAPASVGDAHRVRMCASRGIERKSAEPRRPRRRHDSIVAGERRRRDQAEDDSDNERSLHRALCAFTREHLSRARRPCPRVIASEAKQSRAARLAPGLLRRLAPRNDAYLSSMKRMAIGRPASAPPRPLLNGSGVQRLSDAVTASRYVCRTSFEVPRLT